VTGGSQAQRLSCELGVQPRRLGGAALEAGWCMAICTMGVEWPGLWGAKVGGWVSVPWVRIGTTRWFM